MDNIFKTVYGGDLAVAAFVAAANNSDFVIFANGDGANLWGKEGQQLKMANERFEWKYIMFLS